MEMKTPARRSSPALTLMVVLVVSLAVALLAGCGSDEGPVTTPVAASKGLAAANTAACLQQVADTETLIDQVEAPLSSAAGDYEDLGSVTGGDSDLGDYWDAGKMISSAVAGPGERERFVVGWGYARHVLALRAADPAKVCDTQGNVTTCVEEIDPNVVQVTVTTTVILSPIASIEQQFVVDTNGTEDPGDDRIQTFTSTTTHHNGTVIEVSMTPESPAVYIETDTIVTLSEVVTFNAGLVSRQTNTIRMDVGDVDVEGDEVIWDLSSAVDYFNGASTSISVTETPETGDPDGIRDGDRTTLTADFTAAPANDRLETAVADIVIWVGELDNEEDDLFESVSRTITFDGQTTAGGSPTSTISYTPSELVGQDQEPCSGTFTRDAAFPAAWELETLSQNVTHDCQAGGSATLVMTFNDQTTFNRSITWDGAGTATVNSTRRNGTVINGTFDDVDNTFSLSHTFPNGFDPVSIDQSGSWDENSRSYAVVATYGDDSTESLSVTSTLNQDGSRGLTGAVVNADGNLQFDLLWNPSSALLTGTVSGPLEQSLQYTAAYQQDGSAIVDFFYYDPAEALAVRGHVIVNEDGSGCGTLEVTQAGQTGSFTTCFEADGTGRIEGGGEDLLF